MLNGGLGPANGGLMDQIRGIGCKYNRSNQEKESDGTVHRTSLNLE
jgi:hypothetical protein